MLKFFRQVRQKLLKENRFSSYALYAIGEILLVVIGILIALQINNWNETRKDRNSELVALNELKNEFMTNRKSFAKQHEINTRSEQRWKKYLLTITDRKLPLSAKAIQRAPMQSTVSNISNSSFNAILSSGRIDNISNDSLKLLLLGWSDIFGDYREMEMAYTDLSRKEFFPYERSLIPTYSKGPFEELAFLNEIYSEEEINEFRKKANTDMQYQNITIQIYNRLVFINNYGPVVKETIDEIIRLLEEEIASR